MVGRRRPRAHKIDTVSLMLHPGNEKGVKRAPRELKSKLNQRVLPVIFILYSENKLS